ncbi:hypothetical protein [Sphingomonas sp. SRS2]|uniref:hypothetical protein n=1 Tax=Sphingomonas sp. SRS2 TaxID=133190 RepID=UPI00061849F5|nr:hypothetical protein [Sphingomonas sp. SRS2]KKC24794.1 hypothetical protein WP12_17545 [Sphingomonas sp. SRS2]
MSPEDHNISTDYQPKGSDRNQSDTLDRRVPADEQVGASTVAPDKKPGSSPTVDEKGRPLSGDGTTSDSGG